MDQVLERRLTKVTLIEDINKSVLFLFDRNITVGEFDDLYDLSLFELELTLLELQKQINYQVSRV